jgi:hypothetical protein
MSGKRPITKLSQLQKKILSMAPQSPYRSLQSWEVLCEVYAFPVDISGALRFRRSEVGLSRYLGCTVTVCNSLNRLSERGLARRGIGRVRLTAKGEQVAMKVTREMSRTINCLSSYYEFEYDGFGRLIRENMHTDTNYVQRYYLFKYNSKNQAVTVITYDGGNKFQGYLKCTYSKNSMPIKYFKYDSGQHLTSYGILEY